MKRFLVVLSLLIALVTLVFGQRERAVLPFEGVVEFKLQNIESVQFFEMYIKGERVRTQTKEKLDYVPILIQDYATQTSFIMVTATERYVQAPLPGGGTESETQVSTVEQTGEKETIAGLSCEQFIVKLNEGELEVWATLALGKVAGFSRSFNQENSKQPTWESYFSSKGYSALRAIVYNGEGHEQGRYEVTNVTRKAVPESQFRVPRGYDKVAEQKDLIQRRR